MEHVDIEKLEQCVGGRVGVSGIVEKISNQGGLIFIDISDLKSSAVILVIPDKERAYDMARRIREGYIIEAVGVVKACPLSMHGSVCEIEAESLAIVSARTKVENVIKIAENKKQ